MKPKILIIAGPTASGKKRLALETAERFGGEIVSADSRKVYRYLDIGTAKPSLEDRKKIPYHLINIIDPDESFSAGEWVGCASTAVRDILARSRLPILTGGTGFYISAFCEGLSENIVPIPEVRQNLEEELAASGSSAMYSKLMSVDPQRARDLHEHDTFRVLRALEIYYSTDMTFAELKKSAKVTGGDYDYFTIGIAIDREILYKRINERVDDMVSKGLVDELKKILDMGYSRELVSLDTVGYKEWFPLLDGRKPFEQCLDDVKKDTRRYAKRQMTWFRSKPDIHWVDALDTGSIEEKLKQVDVWLTN
jgi:tRNA dimethylallyltransferase